MPKSITRVRLKPKSLKPKMVRLNFKAPRNIPPPRDGSKLAKILALLIRPTGASLGELVHIPGSDAYGVDCTNSKFAATKLFDATSFPSWVGGCQRQWLFTHAMAAASSSP
jgi:hypothetical protein